MAWVLVQYEQGYPCRSASGILRHCRTRNRRSSSYQDQSCIFSFTSYIQLTERSSYCIVRGIICFLLQLISNAMLKTTRSIGVW